MIEEDDDVTHEDSPDVLAEPKSVSAKGLILSTLYLIVYGTDWLYLSVAVYIASYEPLTFGIVTLSESATLVASAVWSAA